MASLKARDLQYRIQLFADVLEMRGADKADVRVLRDVAVIFSGREDKTIAAFFKLASSVPISLEVRERPVMGDALPTLTSMRTLFAGVAPKDLISGIDSLLALLEAKGDVSIAAFVASITSRVASTPRTKTKKAAPIMDASIVAEYTKQLDIALGDDAKFRSVFEQLRSDPRVGQLEAVEIANRFAGHTPPRTARAKALSGVKERHIKLMEFKGKPSSAGRSAA
jgi:hypothetical protein